MSTPANHAPPRTIDVNAMVSYNIAAIRRRRGWTQREVARKLAAVTGHLLPQASISAMERGADGDRRRRFDAHELYLLAVVLDVPIAYFFLPPPSLLASDAVVADADQPLSAVLAAFLGARRQLRALEDHLIAAGGPPRAGAASWAQQYRGWWWGRVDKLIGDDAMAVSQAAGVLADLLRELGSPTEQPPR